MPALVKASPAVLNGGVALVRYNVADSNDLSVNIDAEFVATAAAEVESRFRVGSPVHPSLNTDPQFALLLSQKRVISAPVLTSCTISVSGGLKYISVGYSSQVEDAETSVDGEATAASREVTRSTELRSLNGNYTQTSILGSILGETTTLSFSFDYYTTSTTIDYAAASDFDYFADALAAPPTQNEINSVGDSDLGQPFNQRGTVPNSVIGVQTTISIRTYRNNLKQYRVSRTSTPIYVQTRQSIGFT